MFHYALYGLMFMD